LRVELLKQKLQKETCDALIEEKKIRIEKEKSELKA